MKIIALQDYTDNIISLYEGEIRQVEDLLATQLKAKGIVGENFPDDVTITPTITEGTEIANININGENNKIYAPITKEVPTVTAIDNGKVLTVVQGEWKANDLPTPTPSSSVVILDPVYESGNEQTNLSTYSLQISRQDLENNRFNTLYAVRCPNFNQNDINYFGDTLNILAGENLNLTPYTHDVFFYYTGTSYTNNGQPIFIFTSGNNLLLFKEDAENNVLITQSAYNLTNN